MLITRSPGTLANVLGTLPTLSSLHWPCTTQTRNPRGIYSATKGAVLRLTDALRVELAPLGVSVMLAAPGFIQTRARDTASDLAASYSQRGAGARGSSLWTGWCVCVCDVTPPAGWV